MATQIILKNSPQGSKVPGVSDLVHGEVAVNTYDGDLYTLRDVDGVMSVSRFTQNTPISNAIFVQQSGNDVNRGDSWDSAFLTIERAVARAWEMSGEVVLIEVGPGVYYTQGHIDLPDDCIVHCVYRAVKICPVAGYESRNVFRVGSGCFIEGPVFEGWKVDSLDVPTEGFAISFRPGAVITRTPFIHKIAVRTTRTWGEISPPLDIDNGNPMVPLGGGVVIADASIISPYSTYPGIKTWGATPIINNGIGYVATNGAIINVVNTMSAWAHKHFYALNGGKIVLSSCSTQYGDYSLVAEGARSVVAPYEIGSIPTDTPTGTLILNGMSSIVSGTWDAVVANGYNVNWTSDYSDRVLTDIQLAVQTIAWTVGSGNETPVVDFSRRMFDVNGNRIVDLSTDDFDLYYDCVELVGNAIAYDIATGSNYRSISVAGAYFDQYYSTPTLSTLIQLIAGTKTAVQSVLTGIAQTTSDALFDNMLEILQSGPSSSDPVASIDPVGLDVGSIDARANIVANKLFVATEVASWMATQITNNSTPFNSSATYTYTSQICIDTVGRLIDGITYDLTYGGNAGTVGAAGTMFESGVFNYGAGEVATVVASMAYLRSVLEDVAALEPVTPSLGNAVAQVTAGTPGSGQAISFVYSRSSDIISAIENDNHVSVDEPDVSSALVVNKAAYDAINTSKPTMYYNVVESVSIDAETYVGAYLFIYSDVLSRITALVGGGNSTVTDTIDAIVFNMKRTLVNPEYSEENSTVTAIGHTWSNIMAGVATSSTYNTYTGASIQDSILEIGKGHIVASGQDDRGAALFVGGLEINSDTGELTGPPFDQAVNRISTKAAISRSF